MSRLRPPPAFAARIVLPGESRQEFDALHAELIAEFAPEGRLETDTVLSLAKCLWRKARLDGLTRAPRPEPASFEAVMDPLHPRYEPGKWTRVVVRSNMAGPPLPPYVPGSWPRARPVEAPAPAPQPEAGAPEAIAPEAGGAPTFESVMEDFATQAKFDMQIARLLRQIDRLKTRRAEPARRGRPPRAPPAA